MLCHAGWFGNVSARELLHQKIADQFCRLNLAQKSWSVTTSYNGLTVGST